MNKKLNYVLFLLGATLANILIMGLLFIIPLIILTLIFRGQMNDFFVIIPFICAIGGGYFIYSKLFTFFRSKVDMEKYFEPFFKKKI